MRLRGRVKRWCEQGKLWFERCHLLLYIAMVRTWVSRKPRDGLLGLVHPKWISSPCDHVERRWDAGLVVVRDEFELANGAGNKWHHPQYVHKT